MKAILRPVSWATFDDLLDAVDVAGEAGHDHATLRPLEEEATQRARRRSRSDGVKPGSSAFVESASSSATPSSPSAARRLTSVRRPSIGVRSSLKSPECTTMPTLV